MPQGLLAFSCVLLLLAGPWLLPEASAQDEDERARTHFDSARVHFDEGEYEAALSEFSASYELSHRDPLLYNLYLCEERLGHPARAADYLRRYLATSLVSPEERPTLERRLANLEERAAVTEREETVASAPVDASPGIDSPSSGSSAEGLWIAGGVLSGLGALALVTTGVLGGLALDEDARVGSSCGAAAGRVCTDAQLETLGALAVGTDVALSLGLVLATAGLTTSLAAALTASPAPTTRAGVAPLPGGGLLVVAGVL